MSRRRFTSRSPSAGANAPRQRQFALALAAVFIIATQATAADKDWDQSPYQVHITIAADTAVRPQPALGESLSKALSERIASAISPLWITTIQVAADAKTRRECLHLRALPWEELPPPLKEFDKLIWLAIRATAQGYDLSAREFDVYTRQWGAIHRRTVPQTAYLPEACFDLLTSVFTPLALIEPITDNDAQVLLHFKGDGLPRRSDGDLFTKPGDVFQPVLRRSDRSGKLAEGGVTPVPWTYLTTAPSSDGRRLADVHTGTRRPFAMQRRGRVEQLAVALKNPPGPAKVRFHARTDPKQGLAGYEVFRNAVEGSPELIGVTDRTGVVAIPPGDQGGVTMILLRSDGQLLAKLPVPAGSGAMLEIPVADNVSRLRAQSESQVVREQLVDVVARRAILISRIRAMLAKNRVEDARKVMVELDSLPTASVFGRTIDVAARKIPASKDATVQRTIDKMFSSTRELLGKFLDRRAIIDLQSQVNAAPAAAAAADPDAGS